MAKMQKLKANFISYFYQYWKTILDDYFIYFEGLYLPKPPLSKYIRSLQVKYWTEGGVSAF